MKQIPIKDVAEISLITNNEGKQVILFTLTDFKSYYANGDVDLINDVYYCHYKFECWSN